MHSGSSGVFLHLATQHINKFDIAAVATIVISRESLQPAPCTVLHTEVHTVVPIPAAMPTIPYNTLPIASIPPLSSPYKSI